MKKILYLMHVDWRWIKQRPHFIAEELSKKYEVHVVYQYRYSTTGMQTQNTPGTVKLHPVYVLPKGDRFECTRKINRRIMRAYIKSKIEQIQPDWIYVCSPGFVDCLHDVQANIIYDCMDDHSLLSGGDPEKIIANETALIQKAKYVLASSKYLKDVVLVRRSCPAEKITLVRNGYIKGNRKLEVSSPTKKDGYFHLCYVGTISSWFDFELIEQSLEVYDDIVYDLVGPVADKTMKDHIHPRIKYHGTVEHSALAHFVQNMDCLIMPFIVNDIVKAVDPVKLYEYVTYGKNSICCKYAEVERFSRFVNLYATREEYITLVEQLKSDNRLRYHTEESNAFLQENSWEMRAWQITNLIEEGCE